ncbi:MAG: TetR/AcrR family transcriptional regulator C-terminal domain-containing protein [Saccharofermentanales bacterium]|jgi:hypothetical protein
MASRNTKKDLINAMKILLKSKKFENITVQNIIDIAEVSRGTFYRYFKDKYDVMNLFYLDQIERIINSSNNDYKWATRAIIQFVMDYCDYFKGVLSSTGPNSFNNLVFTCSKTFYSMVYQNKYKLTNKADIPEHIDFATDFLANGCVYIIDKWIINSSCVSAEQITDWLYKMTPDELQ